ncbi:RNA-directed DNA polymerase, eukaryota, reverse transcriptase zinc-binding domain protein [Tanacetum coccineum]
MPEECVSQPRRIKCLRTQLVCALCTQPVCDLRTQPVCALHTQPVCALRTQSVMHPVYALRTQPVCALCTQSVCALCTQVVSLRDQLQKVQSDIDKDPHNHILKENEALLVKEFYEAERDEEKFLFQQANIKCYENDQIPPIFLKHFEDFLGKTQQVHDIEDCATLFHKRIREDDALRMITEVPDKEIKNAMFDIGDFKTPGPDGFTTAFFKKAWGIIGADVFQTPSRVNDFRPIACCNVLYKCISKIIINRIKHVLGSLVSNNQSAFIPGRQIQDNILLTQEIMKGYNRKGGPKRVAFKIDLQKAYDTVSWKFLKKTLEEFGFHKKMFHWIMQCVTNAGFTLNVNGERIGYFKGRRGLRQGDHVSPYLFTLIIKVFSLMFNRQIERDLKFQYHFGCKTMKLVHVCFADDLLVMCHGDYDSVRVIKSDLDEFSTCSGLLPNNSKSTVFFGSLCEEDRQAILNVLPFAIGKLPNKVKNWKNKSLSYAGRLQLIVVVLESIHVYWASIFLLPITVINEINKLLKGFLWNQGDTTKGKAKVAWTNLCRPKDQDLYDARLKEDLTLRDMITNGQWNWPKEWYEKFPMVTQVACPTLNDVTTDKIVWRNKDGKDLKFFVNIAYADMSIQINLENGGIMQLIDAICAAMNQKTLIISCSNVPFLEIFRAALVELLILNIMERNGRIFRDAKRSCEEVFKCIVEVIKHKVLGITFKDSKVVRDVEDKWKEDSVLRVILGFNEYNIIGGKDGSIMEVCFPRVVMPYPLSPPYSVNGMADPLLMMPELLFLKSLWWQVKYKIADLLAVVQSRLHLVTLLHS